MNHDVHHVVCRHFCMWIHQTENANSCEMFCITKFKSKKFTNFVLKKWPVEDLTVSIEI